MCDFRRILVAVRTLLMTYIVPTEATAWLVLRVISHLPANGVGIVDVVHAWEIMGMSGCRHPDTKHVSMLNRQTLRMIPRIKEITLIVRILSGILACNATMGGTGCVIGKCLDRLEYLMMTESVDTDVVRSISAICADLRWPAPLLLRHDQNRA